MIKLIEKSNFRFESLQLHAGDFATRASEQRMAALEGGTNAISTSSGQAAQ
uniref:Uncharacterized protein n=1 Tax=Rhizophagus irregularis (strain DAOM 181602 / DAOM 197198 / MUCL 43194) TaxID=747089 RepID=U9UUL5_RHIID